MKRNLKRSNVPTEMCGHHIPLTEECVECDAGNAASDNVPEHGPCTWNCGSPSCDAPEYPKEGER